MSFPGGFAQYTCHGLPPNSMSVIRWYVNGSRLDNLNLTNVKSRSVIGVGSLLFTDIPVEFNATRIQCDIVRTSSQTILSQEGELFLQGYKATFV